MYLLCLFYWHHLTLIPWLDIKPHYLANPKGDFPPGSLMAQRATKKQTKLMSLYSYNALLHLLTHPALWAIIRRTDATGTKNIVYQFPNIPPAAWAGRGINAAHISNKSCWWTLTHIWSMSIKKLDLKLVQNFWPRTPSLHFCCICRPQPVNWHRAFMNRCSSFDA